MFILTVLCLFFYTKLPKILNSENPIFEIKLKCTFLIIFVFLSWYTIKWFVHKNTRLLIRNFWHRGIALPQSTLYNVYISQDWGRLTKTRLVWGGGVNLKVLSSSATWPTHSGSKRQIYQRADLYIHTHTLYS